MDPIPSPSEPPSRSTTTVLPLSTKTPSFLITATNRSYKHQYANIYYLRLTALRKQVEIQAKLRWKDLQGNPKLVPQVLEIEKSELCYVVGTIYMEMKLKPNVLDDIARDRSLPAPPPPSKIYSTTDEDEILLEDTSGRIRLAGERITKAGLNLVTGVTVAVLGVETASGDFEVVDVCFAGVAPGSEDEEEAGMDIDTEENDSYVACISGLNISATACTADAQIQLLVEYLTGEEGGLSDQIDASKISRLIIAGNSLAPISAIGIVEEQLPKDKGKNRRYGYDSTSFSPQPIASLSAHLHDIARAMPIHILPGENDPSGTILPQQPFPSAMFGAVSNLSTFSCETNPTYIRLSDATKRSRTFLVNSGQPLNDMYKYLPSASATKINLLESTLRWRHMAPTAPDTLWCHPYYTQDPFLLQETPDVYLVGAQKKFATRLVEEQGTKCRIVMVPGFEQSGLLVLVNMRTLDVKTVKFSVQ